MTADLRAALEREIAAIRECRHCGGESEYDRGRITALDWVARTFAALATPEPHTCYCTGGSTGCGCSCHIASTPEPAPVAEGLDAAYRERNAVVAALIRTNGWPASLMPAPDADGWWIVYAETPQGQVSWHVSPVDIRLFDGIPVEYAKWDGHTTDEKYERVARLAAASPSPETE